MPTIQSKKYPDIVAYVTVEDWENLKKCGVARRKIIIDDSDLQDTVIKTPQAFTPISIEEMREPEMNREELKKWLDDKEIEYNVRISTPKLYQLYLDNKL